MSVQNIVKGLSAADLERALALLAAETQKDVSAQKREQVAAALAPTVGEILTLQPCKPSSKATSAWVGSIYGGLKVEIDGRTYSVQVSIKDDEASAVRKATGA